MVISIWLALIIFIVIVIVAWKLLKFALWILLIIVLAAIVLLGLDYLIGLFSQFI